MLNLFSMCHSDTHYLQTTLYNNSIFPNHRTKDSFVSTANKPLVGTWMTIGDVTVSITIDYRIFFLKVETLLASFLKDVGISEEQFMTACKNGSGSPQFNGMNRVGGEMWHLFVFFIFHYSWIWNPKAHWQWVVVQTEKI